MNESIDTIVNLLREINDKLGQLVEHKNILNLPSTALINTKKAGDKKSSEKERHEYIMRHLTVGYGLKNKFGLTRVPTDNQINYYLKTGDESIFKNIRKKK